MTDAEVYDALNEIFSDIFVRDDIELTPLLCPAHVDGWDSSKTIEIIISLQYHFGIKLFTRDIDSMISVGDMVRVIREKVTARLDFPKG